VRVNITPDRKLLVEKLLGQFGEGIELYFPASPIQHEALWVGAVFENLRCVVAEGDPGAICMAVNLIVKDPMWLPFGKLIKSDLARALRKQAGQIEPAQRLRIISLTIRLLKSEHMPREIEDYAKLIKKFPRSEYADSLALVEPLCDKARHIKQYLNATR
jgi:hypothetical protein